MSLTWPTKRTPADVIQAVGAAELDHTHDHDDSRDKRHDDATIAIQPSE
jgi:hypothetical protein